MVRAESSTVAAPDGWDTLDNVGEIWTVIEFEEMVVVQSESRLWGFDGDGQIVWQRSGCHYTVRKEDGALIQQREFHMGGPWIKLRVDHRTGQRVEVLDSRAIDDPYLFLEPPPPTDADPPYLWREN